MGRRSKLQPASVALPEPATARRAFDRAAARFDAACAAHDHARGILLERLAWLELAPQLVVDAGCGTGRALPLLQQQFPDAAIVGIDCSVAMLQIAGARSGNGLLAGADIAALPFAAHSVDLLLANLVLPWVTDPVAVLAECRRVLSPSGLLLLSATGPATLQELRRAWRSVDDDVHVHAQLDMQTLGDLVMQAGLRDPVLDVEHVALQYSSPARLHAELQALGAGNAAPGRRSSLTGKARFGKYEQALRAAAGTPDGVSVTLELIFLQAWGDVQVAAPEPQFHGIPLRRG